MDIELEPIESFEAPIYHKYHAHSSRAITPFLHAVKRGELMGHLSHGTGKVLFPPLGACPESGTPTSEPVILKDSGTVIGFTTSGNGVSCDGVEITGSRKGYRHF